MKSLKLPPIAIAGIGVFLCLLVVGLIGGLMIKPTMDQIATQTSAYQAAYPDSTAGAQAAARKQVADAKVKVAATQSQWGQVEARLMPEFNVSKPRMIAWQELSHELTYNLGPDLENHLKHSGVVPLFSTVSIAPPPADPNDITTAPLIIPISGSSSVNGGSVPGAGGGGGYSGMSAGRGGGGGGNGSITVGGDFRQILYHVESWNHFNRLVLLDNLSLHGNSPFMAASYNASVIIFPQGTAKQTPPLKKAAGSATNANNGMGGMGPMGPMGPMGGMPGPNGP